MPALHSSLIRYAEYDAARQRLRITFRHTGTYIYFDVPPEIYEGLLNADSQGGYFNEHIRDRFGYAEESKLG